MVIGVELEKFKELPYKEQLKILMEEARKKKDIWLILVINDKMKEAGMFEKK